MNKPQIVDPFIPARPARRPQLASSSPATTVVATRPQPLASVSVSVPISEPKAKVETTTKSTASSPASTVDAPAQPQPARRWSFEEPESWRDRPGKVVGLAFGGLLLGGLSLFSLELGELALAIYAILAIWRRWPSRQAFAVTLGMFGGIMVTSLVSAWRQLADNLAVYAFLLLCVGTFLMAMEMRRDTKRGVKNLDESATEPEQAAAEGVYYRHRSL